MSVSRVPDSLRRQIAQRASLCCEYCGLPERVSFAPHEIDHVVAQKHGGATEPDNLALSCTICNKHKGTDLTSIDPDSGAVAALYNPRRDRWDEHFRLDGSSFVPRSATGRVTIRLLQLNRPDRLAEREAIMAAGIFTVPQR